MAIEREFQECKSIIEEYRKLCAEHPKARTFFIDYTNGKRDLIHRDGKVTFALELDRNRVPTKLLKDLTLH